MNGDELQPVNTGILKRIELCPLLVAGGEKVLCDHTIEELSTLHDVELPDGFALVEVWIKADGRHRYIVGSPITRALREYGIVLPFASRITLVGRNTGDADRDWRATLVVELAA